MKDYYRTLQVDPTAEPEVITAAYKRLVLKYHPDKNPDPSANQKMQEINEAYSILKDATSRANYDTKRSRTTQNNRSSQTGNQQRSSSSSQTSNQQRASTSSQTGNQQRSSTSSQTSNQQRSSSSSQTGNQQRSSTSSQTGNQQRSSSSSQTGNQQRSSTSDRFDESFIESRFRQEWQRAYPNLPLLEQFPVQGSKLYRLDFAHPNTQIAIELDGYEYHSSREQFTRDRERDREIQSLGWRILHFSGKEVCENVHKCVYEAYTAILQKQSSYSHNYHYASSTPNNSQTYTSHSSFTTQEPPFETPFGDHTSYPRTTMREPTPSPLWEKTAKYATTKTQTSIDSLTSIETLASAAVASVCAMILLVVGINANLGFIASCLLPIPAGMVFLTVYWFGKFLNVVRLGEKKDLTLTKSKFVIPWFAGRVASSAVASLGALFAVFFTVSNPNLGLLYLFLMPLVAILAFLAIFWLGKLFSTLHLHNPKFLFAPWIWIFVCVSLYGTYSLLLLQTSDVERNMSIIRNTALFGILVGAFLTARKLPR